MTPVKGLTTSAKFMYDIPEANKDFTHPFLPVSGELKYGQEFHFDYSVDYMLNEEWKAGIGGYFYKQITDDKLNGVELDNMKARSSPSAPASNGTADPSSSPSAPWPKCGPRTRPKASPPGSN